MLMAGFTSVRSITLMQQKMMVAILIFCFILLSLTSCTPNRPPKVPEDLTPSPENGSAGGDKNDACPELDSKLYQLFLMEDPTEKAEQLGFRVVRGKVLVLLVLQDKNTGVPEGFDLEVGTRIDEQVQVLAPFEVLCDLANTKEVIAIRQPVPPILE